MDRPAEAIAQAPVDCDDLAAEQAFWTERLGFHLLAIFPADSPRMALLEGHGLRLALRLRAAAEPQEGLRTLDLLTDDPPPDDAGPLISPAGVRVRWQPVHPVIEPAPTRQATVLTRAGDAAHWDVGRAGLRYRDLLPQRHGGAFIASHIRIEHGGPLPDYVHHHSIRFQAIFCRRGWVRVVYEGQGEPFDMHPGDGVLQPPHIRHRVLESSAGAEVVEIATPAEHITWTDPSMSLPQVTRLAPDHDFHGQHFVRHQAATAPWTPWRLPGFEMQDTGIEAATRGLAGVRLLRPSAPGAVTPRQSHDTEFSLYYVLRGGLTVELGDETLTLGEDDCLTLAAGQNYRLRGASADLHLMEVSLPGSFAVRTAA
jgi:quercetin dioxygenase-like cupin family protein